MAYHRRGNLKAALGAALATAAITGALLAGYSVRQSLRSLVVQRLGAADYTLTGRGYFRANLAEAFRPEWRSCALVAVEGTVLHSYADVTVYGVDDSFYAFHGRRGRVAQDGEVLLSRALARELAAKPGDRLQVLVERPSVIPRESAQGDKENTAAVLRLRVGEGVSPQSLDDFATRAQQGEIRALFVPLAWLQAQLNVPGKANLVLLAGARGGQDLADRFRARFRLEDAGLRLRHRPATDEVVLEHESTILDDRTAERALETAKELGVLARPALVSWVRSISAGPHAIAYSTVAALDEASLAEIHDDQPLPPTKKPPILLNDWAAMDLGVKLGDAVRLEFNRHEGPVKAEFELAGVVPIVGLAADRDFVPAFPGISDQKLMLNWAAPFPMDGRLVRPRDQMYWDLYRTTPKGWIPLSEGRKYWKTRFGSYTSVRFMQDAPELEEMLRADVDPLAGHFVLSAVRRQSLEAAAGSTEFGAYFIYFNSFVVFASLLLTVLILRLGVEKREAEVGLLLAVGATPKPVLTMFVVEGLVVGAVGTLAGVLLSPVYAAFLLAGLRSWWNGAAGTQLLSLSLSGRLMAEGAVAGGLAAAASVWMALQNWEGLAPKAFHIGEGADEGEAVWVAAVRWVTLAAGLILVGLAGSKVVAARSGFFAAGVCLLASMSIWADWLLRRPFPGLVGIPGKRALFRLALRNLSWRRRRTVLSLVLIAPCAFLLVSMETIRQKERAEGTGGFALYAESQAPLLYDGSTSQGRAQLKLDNVAPLQWVRMRLRPGDDVSCLNLYRPRDPRILGVPESFLRSNGFRFTESSGESAETQANPWLLLESQMNLGTIPAIVDQNSLEYVLHKKVGDEVEVAREGAAPLRLRLVAALRDSVFQSELLISEKNFVRLFPQVSGWQVFLLKGSQAAERPLARRLSGYGFAVRPARARLAGYHRVENTYLSAFQMLGALGLLLGTAGLGVLMLRNVWERRREFAMLRAAGFGSRQVARMLVWESAAVLAAGLSMGFLCALVAVAPALAGEGSGVPVLSMLGGLVVIFAGGLGVVRLAARFAVRMPLFGR
ncbi:FtsX-like permease family protein [uncultured Paludibaculum sp.]|uniref:FtsX-like permease family protein n=1 Tax=uncultured Paludibaculum sp. TaxID=1765020 RepID=UPI002AABB550|nr:FtsX-like permease family protein [uncultured Paludibaculum sp.]